MQAEEPQGHASTQKRFSSMTWPQPTPGVDRLVMLAANADLIEAVRYLSSTDA
jgi:hypothetical protein